MHIYTKDEVCMTICHELSIDSKPKKKYQNVCQLQAISQNG